MQHIGSSSVRVFWGCHDTEYKCSSLKAHIYHLTVLQVRSSVQVPWATVGVPQGPPLPGDSRGGSVSLFGHVTGRISFLEAVGPRSFFLDGSQLLKCVFLKAFSDRFYKNEIK